MIQNQNEPDSGQPEVVSHSHSANMSNIDYSKTKHGRFYANHVGAAATLFDIRLILSDVDVDKENNQLIASETLTLFLAPELAFMVHSALSAALSTYTARYGKLRIPEDFILPLGGEAPKAPEGSPQPPASPEPSA